MADKKSKHFIKKPIYPGGQEAFKKFIADNLKYPKEAVENKIEGTVVLKYAIDHLGKVSDIKVIKSLGYGCDEEAKRVIGLLQFEIPKEPRKLRVLFHRETKLFFKLPQKKSPPTKPQKLQYKIVYSDNKAKNTEPETNKKSGYSYTIKLPKQ